MADFKKFEKKQLVKKSEDFSQWYQDVILKAGLADYAPVRGCMVFKPYGFAIWENIQNILNKEIKKAGVENVYFPLFIPEKLLKKEKNHIKGFSPELAVVTIGGGKRLKEKLIVRPTSETIIYQMFSKWISSWRDLPLMVNQWCNVVRWEMRTRLFLRTTEFLWQEGHTVHATHQDSLQEVKRALDMYVNLYRNYFAIDGIYGRKSESEKFPGALTTYTYEMLMPSGLALQGCTSHDLGQNFAKVFGITFLGKDGKSKIPWQTSWGLSSRSIGALIMVHGDDYGLIIPPKLAPIQIVIIPIFHKRPTDKKVMELAEKIKSKLKFRIKIDPRREYSVGWKFNEWELKGVPLRIEIGEKEIREKQVSLARRDNGKRHSIPLNCLNIEIEKILSDIQKSLLTKSKNFLRKNIWEVKDYQELKNVIEQKKGFVSAYWCGDAGCEKKIKEETKATTRVEYKRGKGRCIYCGKKANEKWIFCQAY